jgi:hypothetical protein
MPGIKPQATPVSRTKGSSQNGRIRTASSGEMMNDSKNQPKPNRLRHVEANTPTATENMIQKNMNIIAVSPWGLIPVEGGMRQAESVTTGVFSAALLRSVQLFAHAHPAQLLEPSALRAAAEDHAREPQRSFLLSA